MDFTAVSCKECAIVLFLPTVRSKICGFNFQKLQLAITSFFQIEHDVNFSAVGYKV